METLERGTLELERLQQCAALLRQVLRFCGAVQRLQRQLDQGALAAAARTLAELEHGQHHEDTEAASEGAAKGASFNHNLLRGVVAVQKLLPGVEAARAAVRSRASAMLTDGLAAQAQQDVAAALLAFSALGLLREKVRTAVSIVSNRARRVVDTGIGASESEGDDQWSVLETTCSELHELCLSVWHLQYVMLRVKDASGKSLWEESGLEQTLTEPFWVQLSSKLSGALALPARRTLHRDFPRLYRVLFELARKSMLSYEMLQLPPPHRLDEAAALSSLMRPLAGVATAHASRTRRRLAKVCFCFFGC